MAAIPLDSSTPADDDIAGPAYAELHCVSNFSFLRGASHPEELIERAIALGYTGLAVTDECSFAGSARAHLALVETIEKYPAACDFQLIHGTEIRLIDDIDVIGSHGEADVRSAACLVSTEASSMTKTRRRRSTDRTEPDETPGPRVVLLATSRHGFGNLSQLITLARRAADKGSYRLTLRDVETHRTLLDDCLALLLPDKLAATNAPRPCANASAAAPPNPPPDPLPAHARRLGALLPGRAWIACELTHGADDAAHLTRLQSVAVETGLKLVAAGDVHMHARSRKKLQDTLTAVRLQRPLADCGCDLLPNAERYLRPVYRLARLYPQSLLAETQAIAQRCNFSLSELRYEYPEEIVPPGQTPASYLRSETYAGAAHRFADGIPDHVRQLLEHELALITELGYEPFFLTVYDIVNFARRRAILCQGRGSAANSVVCYCLGITEVDPARMSVLFERFVSKERNEPPDIDVDFEHQRREEVMQYIYEKYGRHRAALTAALHTYRPRGALRDIGKALGLSLDQVDKLAKNMAWWDGGKIRDERLAEVGFDPSNPRIVQLIELTHQLIGFPRHLSQHSGGFVIARDRLDRLVPIENAAMADRTVIQWDKDDLDALGLLKVDVLALGMLSCLRCALDHIAGFYPDPHAQMQRYAASLSPPAANNAATASGHGLRARRGASAPDASAPTLSAATARPTLTLADIPPEDGRVYDMLCRGDSLGVFQVESRAQMNMLPRLKPRTFYDLVIEVAIVRPGPIQGGMVHPYLRRRQKLEPVSYPSPAVRSVLERTLGVSIFQEQVMQLAVVAAGFTPGESDRLRRAMAAWKRKGGLGPFRDKLISGMLARGYTGEYAEQIYQQMQGFGEYGFPESHAASFALLVYDSSWLKCHEPAAFCAALLDSQPLGFYAPAQIVRDAINHGVEVRAIDVTVSGWACALEPSTADPTQPAVRLGLELVSGLSADAGERIAAARAERRFADAADLALRARLSRGELAALAAADALAPLTGHRRQALWAALGVDTDAVQVTPLTARARPSEAKVDLLAPTEGQNIVADYEHTALTLRRHPLALLRDRLRQMRLSSADDLATHRHRQLIRVSGIVTCRQRPGTASGVTFVTLEDETGTINVVVWKAVAETYRRELIGSTLMTVYGRIEREEPIIHVIASRLVDHSALLGNLTVESRDFR